MLGLEHFQSIKTYQLKKKTTKASILLNGEKLNDLPLRQEAGIFILIIAIWQIIRTDPWWMGTLRLPNIMVCHVLIA